METCSPLLNIRFQVCKSSLFNIQEVEWDKWKIKTPKLPPLYWKDPNNHKKFLEELKQRFQISNPKDWGKVTLKQVRSIHGGNMLLECYGGSLYRALKSIYTGKKNFHSFSIYNF